MNLNNTRTQRKLLLRAKVARLMVRVHLIDLELATTHTQEMNYAELLRRVEMYKSMGVEE